MTDTSSFDMKALDAFAPKTTISIKGYDWPLYELTYRDFGDANLLDFMVAMAEMGPLNPSQLLQLIKDRKDDFENIVWVILRKGAPGMTPDRITAKDWPDKATILDSIPFMLNGQPIIGALLQAADIFSAGGGDAVNPSLASQSRVPKIGKTRRQQT